MRSKFLKYNTVTSIIYQIIVIVCGFILPRAIMSSFGSEVNGLVNSITQFLSIVALMDMGVGASVSSTLYKPLAEKSWDNVSVIVTAARRFFKKLAVGLLVYVALLSFAYPFINNSEFDFFYTASLILIISANSFSQFYLGIVDNILIGADQKAYISYISQAAAHLTNTILCVAFIKLGFGIHIVKLITATIYIIRPLLLRMYIKKHYPINRNAQIDEEPLKQKWNAMAQHISECVLDFTDVMILTVFSTLANVSIYSVYNLIAYNMKQFFLTTTNGILSLMGNMWACNEKDKLIVFFDKMEFVIHFAVITVFSCTYVLIVPFISVYTDGINDANYMQPMFAFFICLAHSSHCLRLPYFNLVKAVGHYKETQNCFIISTVINIVISIVLVKHYGLVGVAIGTLIAMLFQTIWLSVYCYKKLLNRSIQLFFKQIFIDVLIYALIVLSTHWAVMESISYFSWIIMAIKVGITSVLISAAVSALFYRGKMLDILNKIIRKSGI